MLFANADPPCGVVGEGRRSVRTVKGPESKGGRAEVEPGGTDEVEPDTEEVEPDGKAGLISGSDGALKQPTATSHNTPRMR
ncbi:MAG: hypothetical protein AAFX99_00325 [Myxococcota bacterium]